MMATKKTSNKFVIHKHAARSLHYDFRLEVEGVLKSWAVPKGPSPNPKNKRLAVLVEDHEMDYINFEGIIEEGYGAGTVMLWDRGTYRNLKDTPIKQSIRKGRVEIWLNGKKLKGGYALVRMKDKQWLLIKMNDKEASARKNPVNTKPKSVKTGRTMTQIAKDAK